MKWQYKWISLPTLVQDREAMLSEMGLNCWELIGFETGLAFFKRPLEEPVPIPSPEAISASLGVPAKVIAEDFGKVSYTSQIQQIQRSKKK